MRWKYLIPRVLIVAMVWGFFAWAFDPILRWGLCKSADRLNGAKVDVAQLESTISPPALKLTNVQIADRGKPGRNLVEFESFQVQLAAGPLAHRKFVIDEGTITGLAWNTPRDDSGVVEDAGDFRLGEHVPLEELRKQVSQLGKTWLKDAAGSAKSQIDPKQLETVQVSQYLKAQWLAKFADYEAKLKDIEARVKNLKDTVKPEGNTLQKIEAYRLAAIEVQKLLGEAKQLRLELNSLGPSAQADLGQIELARQRDLMKIQQKLDILKFDKNAISEALLGPELLKAVEDTLEWVSWTKDNVGSITSAKEPERGRGVDVPFPKPADPHPEFLIRKLHVSGTARVDGEMVPYAGTLENVTSDPKLWGKPVTLELTTDGESKIHLSATIDRSTDVPVYELAVEYRLPKPPLMEWGDSDGIAFQIASAETVWNAKFKVVGDQVDGEVTFHQDDVRITSHSPKAEVPVQVASIEPVRFEWNSQRELQKALTGVLSQISTLDARVQVRGSMEDPKWTLTSNVGPQVATGIESYLATEMSRRQAQLRGEVERLAGEQMAGFRETLTEKFQKSAGRLNVAETQANELVQKFAGRPLDVRGFFRQ